MCSNLSWSPHIKFVCSKSRKVLGVIFRHFYRFSSPKSLLCLYKSLVIPNLSYCSSVWSPPPSSGDARSLENVQFFALKLCSKNWSSSYSSLLSSTSLPTLSSRRNNSKLILTYKIINDILYFPPSVLVLNSLPSRFSRHFDPLNLIVPFSRSSASLHSFVWSLLLPLLMLAPSKMFNFALKLCSKNWSSSYSSLLSSTSLQTLSSRRNRF